MGFTPRPMPDRNLAHDRRIDQPLHSYGLSADLSEVSVGLVIDREELDRSSRDGYYANTVAGQMNPVLRCPVHPSTRIW